MKDVYDFSVRESFAKGRNECPQRRKAGRCDWRKNEQKGRDGRGERIVQAGRMSDQLRLGSRVAANRESI
jgi:hypothetical protein